MIMTIKFTLISEREIDPTDEDLIITPADEGQRNSQGVSADARAFFLHYPRRSFATGPQERGMRATDLRLGDLIFYEDGDENICDAGTIVKITEEPEGERASSLSEMKKAFAFDLTDLK
jgi:hypothetical protein